MLFIDSRIFYAILLAYTGLIVVIKPDNAGAEITEGLGITILIAVLGVFVDLIRTKGFNRSNLPTIIEAIIFTLLGALMLIFGKELGSILQLLLCIAIIINSIANILCIFDYKNIRDKFEKRTNNKGKGKKGNVSDAGSIVAKAISEDFMSHFSTTHSFPSEIIYILFIFPSSLLHQPSKKSLKNIVSRKLDKV